MYLLMLCHMILIKLPLVYINHLNAWQCGMVAMNGENKNPSNVNGAHK
jgi:hypothetical protein